MDKTIDWNELKSRHIFEYYDRPLFFITQSFENKFYIYYFVEEVKAGIDKWIFSEVSENECSALIKREESVLLFLNQLKSNNRLYYLWGDFSSINSHSQKELITLDNFDIESFPEEDFFVDVINQTE